MKVLGRFWQLRFAPHLKNWGDCDSPAVPHKEIRVSQEARGVDLLDTLLHELLHAAGWHIREDFVEQFASDAARVLWRVGYRLVDPED